MPFWPIRQKPYQSIEEVGNRSAIAKFVDCRKDDGMSNLPRSGLGSAFTTLGSGPVTGAFEWVERRYAAFVSNKKLYKVENNGNATEITGALFSGNSPTSFASFGNTLYAADGGRIISWDGGATCSYIADPDAPQDVTHVSFVDQYLVALDSSGIAWFSDVNAPGTWIGEFFNAESKPDKTVALHVAWNEIAMFGESTIEWWGASGNPSGPFARLSGANTERGVIAPFSIVQEDNTYFFLDEERRLVRLNMRDPMVISTPIDEFGDNALQKIPTVSDAIGFVDPKTTTYILTFPTSGVTWAYDYKRDVWAQWSYYDGEKRDNFLGRNSCYVRSWNKTLVGSRLDGKVYELSNANTDDDGQEVLSEIWTANQDWQSSAWKVCSELYVRTKRGIGGLAPSVEPFAELYYRDNGETAWRGPRHINLGRAGETETVARLHQLGRYRSRQWRIRFSGLNWALTDVEERIG